MSQNKLLSLAILLLTTGVLVGYFFDVPRYIPAIFFLAGAFPAIEAGKDK